MRISDWSSDVCSSDLIEQFRNDEGEMHVAVGDTVKVALDSIANGFGETVLSREKAKRAMVWDELEEALENNQTITGRSSGKVRSEEHTSELQSLMRSSYAV